MKKLLFISIFLAFVASINAQTITAGMNGAQLRAAINNKVIALSDSLATVADSITAHTSSIQLRLLKSDTASMLSNYTRNGELNSALAAKVNVSDTAAMLSPYALTSELGDAGIAIGDVRDEIADSLNTIRAAVVMVADTSAMLANYARTSELGETGVSLEDVRGEISDSLVNYLATADANTGYARKSVTGTSRANYQLAVWDDDNYLKGGASAYWKADANFLGSSITTGAAIRNVSSTNTTPNIVLSKSYSNWGIGGNLNIGLDPNEWKISIIGTVELMGFYSDSIRPYKLLRTNPSLSSVAGFRIPHGIAPASPVNGDLWTTTGGLFARINGSTDTLATTAYARQYGGTGTVTMDNVQDEIADSLNLVRAAVVMITDTSAMLGNYTRNGELNTALANYVAEADTATILGNYARNGEVAGQILDSLNARIGSGINLSDVAVMLADSLTGYITPSQLSDSLDAAGVGVTIGDVRDEIADSLNARIGEGLELSDVAVMKADSTAGPGHYASWYDMTTGLAAKVNAADTATMLSHYALLSEVGGGEVTLSDVQNEIADSLNAIRSNSIPGLAAADTADLVATQYYVATHGGSSWDSTYVHYRIDSLVAVIDNQATEIANLWNAVESLGNFDLTAPAFLSAELGSFADDTLLVLLDTTDVRQDSIPLITAFTLYEGAVEFGLASVDISNDSLFIVLDSVGVYGATYTLDYTRGTPALQDSTGNKTANWTARSVTNNFGEPEAGVPAFLNSDGYTFTWVEAQATNLTLNGTQVTAINDKGPNNHDWTGQGTPGTQWDSANEELDFTYGSAAGLSVSSAPTTMPVTVYMVVRLADWADGHAIFYFSIPNTRISQGGSTPEMLLFAGQYNLFEATDLGSYGIITATINGANSSLQWNDDTPVTGNAGTNTLDNTYYIGYDADNANMSIKEVIVRNTTESAQNKTDVKAYLYSKYSITP